MMKTDISKCPKCHYVSLEDEPQSQAIDVIIHLGKDECERFRYIKKIGDTWKIIGEFEMGEAKAWAKADDLHKEARQQERMKAYVKLIDSY